MNQSEQNPYQAPHESTAAIKASLVSPSIPISRILFWAGGFVAVAAFVIALLFGANVDRLRTARDQFLSTIAITFAGVAILGCVSSLVSGIVYSVSKQRNASRT